MASRKKQKETQRRKRLWRVAIVAVCITFIGSALLVQHFNSLPRGTLMEPDYASLERWWNDYKARFIENSSGRTIDPDQANISTSEGQSYAMLRAVWLNDRPTFKRSWQWAVDNLQRDDHLFAWRFGPLSNGSYGIQRDRGGNNTASDGDTDIALALLLAYERWNAPEYLQDAQMIIRSIWRWQVISVKQEPLLAANDLEREKETSALINPSYLAPYAYKIFATYDKTPGHNWNRLADNSYAFLSKAIDAPLDTQRSAGLPPDWVTVDRRSGALSAPENSPTHYSYDALRTSWRLALDWQWFGDKRAYDLLKKMNFLARSWQQDGTLAAGYRHDGTPLENSNYDSLAMYGGSLGYFLATNTGLAQEIVDQKLAVLNQNTANYYDANWAWFGLAQAQGALINFTDEQQ